jgi:ABC-type cobalamin transport system ATPase subunit
MPICEVFKSAALDRPYQTMQQNGVAILNDSDDFNQTLASAFAVRRCHKWVNTSHWSGQKIGLQFVLMLFNGVWI